MQNTKMLEEAQTDLDIAFPYAGVDEETRARLRLPEKTLQTSLCMRHDSGELKIYPAYISQYCTAMGVGKGGMRLHPNVNKDEIETLAFWMTFKNAIMKIPYGGLKAGVCIDYNKISHREYERIIKLFVDSCYDFMGPDRNVLGPDLYTDDHAMSWIYTRYREINGGLNCRDICTGKPVALGGIPNRKSATGHGGFYCLSYVLNNYFGHLRLPSNKHVTIAIQGFGQVGYWFAKKCFENGLKVVAISNINEGYYDSKGLNILAVKEALDAKQTPPGDKINNQDLLSLPVDFLVPAAIENVITGENVEKIKAVNIFELANGPIDKVADDILHNKGIKIFPGILCNGGGVCVSYFEWLQNRHAVEVSEDQVEKDLKFKMEDATRKIFERHLNLNVSLRTAAYVLGLKRIGEAIESLGNKNYFSEKNNE